VGSDDIHSQPHHWLLNYEMCLLPSGSDACCMCRAPKSVARFSWISCYWRPRKPLLLVNTFGAGWILCDYSASAEGCFGSSFNSESSWSISLKFSGKMHVHQTKIHVKFDCKIPSIKSFVCYATTYWTQITCMLCNNLLNPNKNALPTTSSNSTVNRRVRLLD